MVDRPKSGGRRAKSSAKADTDSSDKSYKRLEELKEIMGSRHGRGKKVEEVKMLTKESELEPYKCTICYQVVRALDVTKGYMGKC